VKEERKVRRYSSEELEEGKSRIESAVEPLDGREDLMDIWTVLVLAFLFLWLAVSFRQPPSPIRRDPTWRTEVTHW
jgi:hypothetical protein